MKSVYYLFGLAAVVVVLIGCGGTAISPQSPRAMNTAQAPAAPYRLQLLSMAGNREYGYNIVSGEVKNISNESLENVEAVVSFYTGDGVFVKSDDALIEYNPILPGQTSPWKVMTTDNPLIQYYKAEFKYMFGGTIASEDKRPEQWRPGADNQLVTPSPSAVNASTMPTPSPTPIIANSLLQVTSITSPIKMGDNLVINVHTLPRRDVGVGINVRLGVAWYSYDTTSDDQGNATITLKTQGLAHPGSNTAVVKVFDAFHSSWTEAKSVLGEVEVSFVVQ